MPGFVFHPVIPSSKFPYCVALLDIGNGVLTCLGLSHLRILQGYYGSKHIFVVSAAHRLILDYLDEFMFIRHSHIPTSSRSRSLIPCCYFLETDRFQFSPLSGTVRSGLDTSPEKEASCLDTGLKIGRVLVLP